MKKEIRNYEDLAEFVISLPGSGPPDGLAPKYLYYENPVSPKLEKALSAEDALYVFNKYKMAPADRVRLITAILTIREVGNNDKV